MITLTRPNAGAPALPIPYRLTVSQYHRMLEAGILNEGAPIELIEGVLVRKMTQGRRHVLAMDRLNRVLTPALPAGWHAEWQPSIVVGNLSEPEPDGAILRGAADDYPEHPTAEDVGMVIEVSDSSLEWDRNEKGAIYAASGIPIYWILNLVGRQIEVYTDPTGPADEPGYRMRQNHLPGASVPLILDGATVASIPVADLLP